MQTSLSPSVCRAFLGCQVEKVVDELNLSKKVISCHPSSLPLPDHVDCFVALNRSSSRLEFSEALLSVHSTFDGSMILFENVVQVLHGSVSTAVAQRPYTVILSSRVPDAIAKEHDLKSVTWAELIAFGMAKAAARGETPAAKEIREVTEGKLAETMNLTGHIDYTAGQTAKDQLMARITGSGKSSEGEELTEVIDEEIFNSQKERAS